MRAAKLMCAMVLAAALAACGDVSNEELQALALLPDHTIGVQPPADDGEALTSADTGSIASPLNDPTRPVRRAADAAAVLNGLVFQIVSHVQAVSHLPPTSHAAHRWTWGPFALRGKFFARVTIEAAADAACHGETEPADDGRPRFRFVIELAKTRAGEWREVVKGTMHGDDFDHSCGAMTFDKVVDRAFGGPANAGDPDHVEVWWNRDDTSRGLDLDVTYDDEPAHPALASGVVYHFERALADGSGRFVFHLPGDFVLGDGIELLRAEVQWSAHETSGRADWRLSGGDLRIPRSGVYCWDVSTHPAGVYVEDSAGSTHGSVLTCGSFQDPLTP